VYETGPDGANVIRLTRRLGRSRIDVCEADDVQAASGDL